MVIEMSESIVMRYLKHAIIDMYENNRTEVLCPCRRCKRGKWFDPYSGKLQGHLLTNGFMHGHTQWMSDDGAEVNGATAAGGNNGRQEGGHHDIDDDEELVAQDDNLDDDNNLDDDEEVPLASVVRDPHLQDLLLEKTKGAKRKSKLEQLEIDSNTPLYDSGRGLGESRLRVALDVLQMKAKHGWTDTSVDDILEYVKDLLPAGNTCPGSLAEAKRITCPLDLPHEKYHACINDCIMYRKEHMDKTKCPVCEAERYKKGKKKAPRKVVWYFPLAPRLQRFYADRKEAKLMRWHAERKEAVLNDKERIEHPVLTHPSDASQWKALDNEFGSFGADPRNIRLGASTDGFNPFGNQSSTHSTWPVFVWIYNLPPWLCMKRKYIQMSMLIQGPTQPGNDINMYLELLKEELETLWAEEGVDTWDAVAEEYFPLRAALITTVQDYLGYGYISCQVCHGHKACVRCMEETMFLQLGKDPGSSKTVYMGHRRWLQKTDPWRKRGDLFDGTNEPRGPPRKKSGEEIDTLLKGWKECPAPGKIRQKPGEKKKKKETTPLIGVWKRRSVFWDLPYWKILDTPHCLDVMHITKNVCESLLGTLLNMPDRTKDGPKARHDLKVLGIREELQIPPAQEGQSEEEADGGQKRKRIKQPDYYCPPSCFTFSPAEVDQFFNCLLGVRVPFGYSGLISRYMDPKKRNFSGMKSHDCHVMMTQILPVAIRGIMDDHVRATLTGLCNFFDVITRKSISVKKLARLQEEIVVILCEMEMYFPPAFFDVMVHLLIHIMDDIVSLGPAFLHNMMPFERMNGVIKGYVRNRSHPDGSIVQGWLTEECISFCTNYLDIEDPVGLPQNKHVRRFEGVGHKNGRKELHVHMSGRTSDFDRANLVALQHIDLIDPWLKEHKTMIENSGKPMMTEAEIYREHNSSFARWFKDHIDANPPPMDSDKDKLVLALSHGPAPNIMTYQAYDINGYTFYTEEKDKNSVYQNSGVTMDSWTGDVKTRYYGRIEEIWELNYAGEKVPMFRIRWAKSVRKEDRYFTTMFLPEANKSKSTNATAQNEPWVLAEHVHQCFFITDPSRPSRVIVRRGKRTIVGMDGVANEEDFEGQLASNRAVHPPPCRREEENAAARKRTPPRGRERRRREEEVSRGPPSPTGAIADRAASRAPRFQLQGRLRLVPLQPQVQATMSSQEELEEHYNRHFFRTEEDAEAAGVGGDEDHEMEDAAGGSADEPSGNEASAAAGGSTYEPSGDEATGAAGGGGETSGDDPSGAAGSSGTGTSGAKRPRKARRQNTVGTGRDTVKEVDPASGLPVEPKDVAKGYGNQLACILREVVNLNETDLRAESKAPLRAQLIARLHARYKFLGDYASSHQTNNIVNSQALLKFTKHLSSYKYMVRKLIAEGKGFEEVHSAFPHVTQADFDAFVANEELQATKNRKLWGKEMRELNIGNHNLGSRGYEGKEPYWAKEDEAYVNAGIENPWLKYKDPLERRFIRSRYHKKKLTGELVTDPKVVTDIIWFTNDQKVLALEKKLEEERQRLSQGDEGSSSQASTGRVAWDKPLVRALNIVNEHSPTRRPHRGRVAGAGTGYKHGHYGLSSAADKNARNERKQREAEEMRESILAQVQSPLESKQISTLYKRGMRVANKAPPKMQVVSFNGSNSMVPPSAGNDNVIMETPPAAGNVAGARDSPSMPGSSPSVTCTPAAACAGPSTLAELNALTALSTPCTFLMRVNDELKDVARGSILRPLDKKWHTRDMADDVYRVEVDRALPGYEDLFPPNQPHGADDDSPLNLASLKGWVLLWPKTLIRINTYSGSTASKDKHLAAPHVSVPPRQPAPVVIAPPERPAAPEVSAPPQQPAAPEAEEYERDNFQWDIPTSSQVVHEDAPGLKYVCSKKLFDSQETAEEENPEEVATAAVKNMLSPNTLRATATTAMEGPSVQPKKRKRQNKKDAQDKAAAAKSKDKVPLLDKLPNNWRPLHHLGQPMLPEHVVKKLTPDMRSLHETVLHVENLLLKSKDPGYPLFVAKVPTGMNFVEKYPADLCFIRFNDIFSIYRMQALHFSVVRLVALSLSSQIVKEGTPTIAIMDPFYMRESIICNPGDRAIATQQVEDFMLANIKKGAILIPYFPEDKFCTLIVVHPQHSHAVYLDSGRDRKKDYSHIRALLNDALTGFANKAGPLKVERKSRGGLVLTHTTNFPCLRQSTPDNGMDAWYAILQMQEYIKYADDMLLPENLRNRFANMADVPDREIRKNWGRIQQFICTIILQDVNNRSGEFFYGYGLPPNDEIDLRLEMSRDERPFNSLEGCRPFPPRRTT
ncbi:hypothetical protein QYE76_058796 [Lolium multiflorum]|uniref:Transposon protein, putative, CACTA, En/Spm sub-class n=1 Tax=Lolium multiflorum TaxID=4521 RepID=A0AAD8T680_LOLMU|nr:hypothetical protein QYE76_058796 [Lolium multiflorum]